MLVPLIIQICRLMYCYCPREVPHGNANVTEYLRALVSYVALMCSVRFFFIPIGMPPATWFLNNVDVFPICRLERIRFVLENSEMRKISKMSYDCVL